VFEAGDDGSAVMERVLIPALTYTDGIATPGSQNDWGYWSNTMNRWLHQPRGKILGGSTAVNALYMVSLPPPTLSPPPSVDFILIHVDCLRSARRPSNMTHGANSNLTTVKTGLGPVSFRT
jgi:hypothetical protein